MQKIPFSESEFEIRGEYLNEKEFAKVQEVANANEGRLPHPVPRCAWAYEVTG